MQSLKQICKYSLQQMEETEDGDIKPLEVQLVISNESIVWILVSFSLICLLY